MRRANEEIPASRVAMMIAVSASSSFSGIKITHYKLSVNPNAPIWLLFNVSAMHSKAPKMLGTSWRYWLCKCIQINNQAFKSISWAVALVRIAAGFLTAAARRISQIFNSVARNVRPAANIMSKLFNAYVRIVIYNDSDIKNSNLREIIKYCKCLKEIQ